MASWPTASTSTTPSAPAAPATAQQAMSAQWAQVTNGRTYNPAEFYTAARNQSGLAERLNIRMPTALYDIAVRVARSDDFPYGSVEAFVRDAMVHRLHYLESNASSPELLEALENWKHTAAMDAAADEYAEALERIEGIVEKVDAVAQRATKVEDWRGLWWLLNKVEEDGQFLREPFRTSVLEVVQAFRSQIPPDRARQFDLEDRGMFIPGTMAS